MSMVLFACVAAGAAAIGWVSGRKARERHDQAALDRSVVAQAPPDPFSTFPCGLKDVLARSKEDEILLTGGFRLSESGAPLAAIFFGVSAPGIQRVVVAFPDRSDIFWLDSKKNDGVSAEVPSSLPWQDVALDRTRRIPVLVERFGMDLPDADREMIFAEYRGGAGHAGLVLKGAKHAIVAAGDLVSFSSLEHFPGS